MQNNAQEIMRKNRAKTLDLIKDYIVIVGESAEATEGEFDIIKGQIMRDIDGMLLYPKIMALLQSRAFDYHYDIHTFTPFGIYIEFGKNSYIELSIEHRLPEYCQLFYKEIDGVKVVCGIEDEEVPAEECCDYEEDMITYKSIKNPLIEKVVRSEPRWHKWQTVKAGRKEIEVCKVCGCTRGNETRECRGEIE